MKDNDSPVEVPYEVVSSDTRQKEIIALVDPATINSTALMTASRVYGSLEEKYEKMEVFVDFILNDSGGVTQRKGHDLYLLMVNSSIALMYYDHKTWLYDQFTKLPKAARSLSDAMVGFFFKSGRFIVYLSPLFASACLLRCCCCA